MRSGRRLALGQWFTPPQVADLTLSLVLPDPAESRRLIDPACGDGVFLDRARARGVSEADLVGVDIDDAAATACRSRLPHARVVTGDIFAVDVGTGFDAVVGNPPYVRQERLSGAAKRQMVATLAADWPDTSSSELEQLVGRGDLAAAFILHSLHLARPGARLGFVVSSALLDAGYAGWLWHLFARYGRVVAVVDAPRERWFREAAVNAVILIMERGSTAEHARFVRLRVDTEAAAARVSGLADLDHVGEVRQVLAADPGSWAAALRADATWFAFADRAHDALVRLDEVAEVRRGVTSGANGFFYLTRARAAELTLEPELLAPLVRSPRERGAATIAIDPAATSHVALVCPRERAALADFPAARKYIDANRECRHRPTLRARSSWWSLPVRPARLFLTKAYAGRFVQRLAAVPVVADQRVYSLHVDPARVDIELLAAVLNSTFTAFALASLGRASLGEGALEWTVADATALPILDFRRLDATAREAARAALAALARRPIKGVAAERDRADRRALDVAVAGAGRDLDDIIDEVHGALIASVEQRARRARQ